MAFDPTRARAVLFDSVLHQTWEWDGTTWIRHSAFVTPLVTYSQQLAFDATIARVVLYDGPPVSGAVYAWDGVNWTSRPNVPQNFYPGLRLRHTLVFDSARQQLLLFGGSVAGGALSDVWHWNGTAWSLTDAGVPQERIAAAVAHDPIRNRAVLFGGEGLSQWKLGDTWEWDGVTWRLAIRTGGIPPCSYHALAFDPNRQRVLLFGGRAQSGVDLGVTWIWVDGTWQALAPSTPPSARHGHAMVTDTARSRIVLFGGRSGGMDLADTWEWDGTRWIDRAPALAPQPSFGHAMAYDSRRGGTVLFGGAGGQQTWEWDGNAWSQRTPATLPPARTGQAMAYDQVRQRVVMFGGVGANNAQLADVWEWNGTDWLSRTTATTPRARSRHVLWFDPARETMLTFGGVENLGTLGSYVFSDLWRLSATHPASVETFGSGCAGSAGTPLLATIAGQRPWSGEPLTVQLSSLSPGRAAWLFVGSSRAFLPGSPLQMLPLDLGPLGAPGCSLLVSPDVLFPLLNLGGTATLTLPIPPDPRLLAARFVMQGFVADLGVNPLGVVASNGLEGLIGTR